ncbi:MAG TPA: hypothetical protein VMP89_16860 [Solirubrobacteraceae bacterium]|nr:hypothetical protein [Solirubrobacteraceae bacterium]
MFTALVRLVIASLVATLLVPVGALADADPASDVLLGASVFYPYNPPVSPPVEKALNAEVAAAAAAHFPIKVALIGSPVDLGAIPSLFDKPQTYANYLDQEISFNAKQRLLVVMPNGYGAQGLGAAATSAAAALTKPADGNSNTLARAAIAAIPRLAAASGDPVRAVSSATSTSSGGSSAVLPAVIVGLAALAAAAAVIVIRRRRDAQRPQTRRPL